MEISWTVTTCLVRHFAARCLCTIPQLILYMGFPCCTAPHLWCEPHGPQLRGYGGHDDAVEARIISLISTPQTLQVFPCRTHRPRTSGMSPIDGSSAAMASAMVVSKRAFGPSTSSRSSSSMYFSSARLKAPAGSGLRSLQRIVGSQQLQVPEWNVGSH